MVNKPSPGCNFGNLYRDTDGLTFHTSIPFLANLPAHPRHLIQSVQWPFHVVDGDGIALPGVEPWNSAVCDVGGAKPVIIEASTADFVPAV